MKAFTIKSNSAIYVHADPVSMSYGFPRLSELANKQVKGRAESGDLFVFTNKKRSYLKILYHHGSGFCMFSKRLAVGCRFSPLEDKTRLSLAEMSKLVDEVVEVGGGKKLRRLKAA